MSIVPACAEESGDGSVSSVISSATGSSGGTGGDTGSGGATGGETSDSSTGDDTGSGGATGGDTGGSSTGDDTGSGDTGGETGGSGTGDDTGSGDTGGETGGSSIDDEIGSDSSGDTGSGDTSGDTDDDDTGDDTGTTPVLFTTISPATQYSSSDGGSGSSDGTGDSGSSGARTLAIVSVSLPPAGAIPLNENSVGDGYTFTGFYASGGSIMITGSGTAGSPKSYYLTADLTASSILYAIQISGSNVILDGQDNTGTSHTITCSRTTYGIDMEGEDVTVQNVDVSHFSIGIASYGSGATITGNTANSNEYGIYSWGGKATITGNTASENQYGFYISESLSDTVISGNRITKNSGGGIYIKNLVGSGSNNAIYDNYLANENNIKLQSGADPGAFTWNNPAGPTAGTNVVGGPTIAGNYWSNPAGKGWSDERFDPDGYSKTEDYEVVAGSGVYDHDPLVTYPHSVPVSEKYGTGSLSSPDSLPADFFSIVIASITIPAGTSPGTPTTLTLTLRQDGSIPMPQTAIYVFVPADEAAAALGEFTATVTNGQFDEVTLPFTVPSEPGVYEYSFTPYLVQINPLTGEEIRVPSGPPVTFTVTVGDDGSVSVS